MTPARGMQIGGEVELLDHDGQAFRLGAPHDRRTLVLFGFTSCPSVCPTALADAQLIARNFGEDLAPRVVFITLDPERDSAPILKEYVKNFDQRFIALTGSASQISQATESYRVNYRRVATGSSYTIDHSAYSYLLDERGRVERLYAYGTPAQTIIGDLRRLAQQRSASR